MSLQDYELASQYQALDTAAVADGAFVHTHVVRALAKGTNYLVRGKGHELLTLAFDARIAGNPDAPIFPALVDCVAGLQWNRMLPGRWQRPKVPGLNTMDVIIQARVTPNASVLVQFETLHGVIDMDATGPSERVFGIVGPASYAGANDTTKYAFRGIPIDEGPFERLGFWVRAGAMPTPAVGDVSTRTAGGAGSAEAAIVSLTTHGDTATLLAAPGVLWNIDSDMPTFTQQYVTAADASVSIRWLTTGGDPARTWAADNYCMVHAGPALLSIGASIYQAQIVGVPDDRTLILYPPPPAYIHDYAGKFFQIRQLPTVQIVSIACFANWRTS